MSRLGDFAGFAKRLYRPVLATQHSRSEAETCDENVQWLPMNPINERETDAIPDEEFVNLPALAEQLVVFHEGAAAAKGVVIAAEVEPDVLVLGDAASLRRVLLHLFATVLTRATPGERVMISGTMADGIATVTISAGRPQSQSTNRGRRGCGYWQCKPDQTVDDLSSEPDFLGQILTASRARLVTSRLPGDGLQVVLRIPQDSHRTCALVSKSCRTFS